MKISAKSYCCKGERLRPTREKGKDGIGRFCADDSGKLLARGASNACETAELRQQCLASTSTDTSDFVELGTQIAHRARASVERDREAMRFVADSLNQQ